eukprot:CAMPEP_0184695812 /NCGR_PEP_ID=MMETSP0313-20130426/3331_1 /TAXON_ID=2792 /ORGANISM="Porphyridium aerugineum, Strain SAG 1380-2" /LENGTH=178 /DNA_ID=CAMNT_0027154337 /DNA_START=29 /DNA_END=565 /DNA_ORIENTATION=-
MSKLLSVLVICVCAMAALQVAALPFGKLFSKETYGGSVISEKSLLEKRQDVLAQLEVARQGTLPQQVIDRLNDILQALEQLLSINTPTPTPGNFTETPSPTVPTVPSPSPVSPAPTTTGTTRFVLRQASPAPSQTEEATESEAPSEEPTESAGMSREFVVRQAAQETESPTEEPTESA